MNAEMIAALRELEREKGIAFETILRVWRRRWPPRTRRRGSRSTPTPTTTSSGSAPRSTRRPATCACVKQELEEIEPAGRGRRGPGRDEGHSRGAEVEVTDDFKGRIGAQTAKQVIFQKLRDAEREMTYEEFAGREGDVVTGIVQQQERRYTLLDLGKVEALLPQAEQVPSEPLPPRRAAQGVHHRGPQAARRAPRSSCRDPPRPAEGAVRAGGARDRRRHRRDQGRGPRAGAPLEDRGRLERARRRSGRRLRGPQGLPRAHGRQRAPWREDRRRPVVGRPRRASWPTRCSRRR